jgi:hypothetical protein
VDSTEKNAPSSVLQCVAGTSKVLLDCKLKLKQILDTSLDMLGLELALRPTRSEGVVHLV